MQQIKSKSLTKKELLNNKKRKALNLTNSIYLLSTIAITLFIYFFSLFREWQAFDERVFYNETIFPIPTRLDEISELIKSFVLNYHIESTNTFFSNNLTVRSNTLASILVLITSFFLKKNAFLYHLLQLSIHLLNVILVWFIFKKIAKLIAQEIPSKTSYLFVSLFTLLWSLHSANTEAILLVTNWDTLLTYTFCFSFILYEVSLIESNRFTVSKLSTFGISILFFLTMLFTEYAYTLPLILFFIIFSFTYKNLNDIKSALLISVKKTNPYFLGIIFYIITSLSKEDSPLVNIFQANFPGSNNSSSFLYAFNVFTERNLWLVPQIFTHLLKILFFPITLSTYQSNLIPLAKTLIEPISILCMAIYFLFLTSPIILFLIFRKTRGSFICPLIYAFFFSVFPFLHVILPTYCLAADRYCYFPSSVLFLILFSILFLKIKNQVSYNSKHITITLSCVLVLLGIRTLVRSQEWNNSYSLYQSALKVEKNPLYKGQRLIIFADYIGAMGNQLQMEKSLNEAFTKLKTSIKELKKLRKKYPRQPITLKLYGLDYDTLLMKAAYGIATIKHDNFQEPAEKTLKYFEKFIKNKLHLASVNQFNLYADLLSKTNNQNKAKEILEYAYKKYPYSSSVIYSLADYYLLYENNLDKSLQLLQRAYKLYPNNVLTLYKLFKYYEKTNDLPNQAKFAYLLGLREHSASSYQRAVQIYLDLNQLPLAYKALKKLARLRNADPITFLLTSRYLDLVGKRENILQTLTSAYFLAKSQKNTDPTVTKSILLSLINVNSHVGKLDDSKKYLKEFQAMKDLTTEDKNKINEFKTKLGIK
ncbi:MAG: hypothetical protein HYY52_01565 [Candidatus Melainabacteria bacterium]|nr:hypothetical protein [Candidatus Melainabacteria bacterium]